MLGPWRRWWRFRKVHRAFGLKFWAFVSGGGALPGPLEQFWNALGFVLVQGYGMTETTALITLNHPFHVARGTIGKPLPGREVKLGPDGEVLVRGPMISGRHLARRRDCSRARDEWLATGDLAERAGIRRAEVPGPQERSHRDRGRGESCIRKTWKPRSRSSPALRPAQWWRWRRLRARSPARCWRCAATATSAAAAIEGANARLAEFQRIRRWVL